MQDDERNLEQAIIRNQNSEQVALFLQFLLWSTLFGEPTVRI